jgi:hypothetical protein
MLECIWLLIYKHALVIFTEYKKVKKKKKYMKKFAGKSWQPQIALQIVSEYFWLSIIFKWRLHMYQISMVIQLKQIAIHTPYTRTDVGNGRGGKYRFLQIVHPNDISIYLK